jgi:hypothetical protein
MPLHSALTIHAHADPADTGTVNLTFLALVVGSVVACSLISFQERFYQRSLAAHAGKAVPEARMACALLGTWLLPAGLFIAAWTSYPRLPWIAPLIGAAVFGFGFFQIIYSILNYVVDGYGHYAASALAGVVLVRNLFGAGFPLFARQMYVTLGNQWATCLLALLSLLLVSVARRVGLWKAWQLTLPVDPDPLLPLLPRPEGAVCEPVLPRAFRRRRLSSKEVRPRVYVAL